MTSARTPETVMASHSGAPWWRRVTARMAARFGSGANARQADAPARAPSKEQRDRDHAERRALHAVAKRRADEEREARRREDAARRDDQRLALERTLDAAHASYLRVRDWAGRMRQAGGSPSDALTETERRMLDALAPLWNADRHTIATLRAWCDPLNGAPTPEPAQPSAESLERLLRQVTILRKQNGAETLVPEPATLGAWGAVVAGQRHSDETLKFAVATAALRHGAVLTPFRTARNRRIVWEIGGGWGGFAYHFKTLCPNVTYVITGLPDRLLVSAVYLTTVFPDARWRLQGESGVDDTWSDWEHLDFLFVAEAAAASLRPPRLDLTIDLGELLHMSPQRVSAHVQRAFEWGSPYVYSMVPARAVEASSTPWPLIEPWYWPHPVPLRSERSTAYAEIVPHEDNYAHMVGWRRIRT